MIDSNLPTLKPMQRRRNRLMFVLRLLADRSDRSMPLSEIESGIMESIAPNIVPTGSETLPFKTGSRPKWRDQLGFDSSAAVNIGWLVKDRKAGTWKLTDQGEKEMKEVGSSLEEFSSRLTSRYAEWDRTRSPENSNQGNESDADSDGPVLWMAVASLKADDPFVWSALKPGELSDWNLDTKKWVLPSSERLPKPGELLLGYQSGGAHSGLRCLNELTSVRVPESWKANSGPRQKIGGTFSLRNVVSFGSPVKPVSASGGALSTQGTLFGLSFDNARSVARQIVQQEPGCAEMLAPWLDPDDDEADPEPVTAAYGIADISANGCFLPENRLIEISIRLREKKNVILQGPPGTGKTWLAKRLGKALIGKADPGTQLRAVQFHPNLSYEDFVRGWRPSGDGKLTLADGPFLTMASEALSRPADRFVMVIEEINRGNPASIFGELLTLLEADKRSPDEALSLCYYEKGKENEKFHIPDNMYVIGTMNLADRSLAMVDLALRRRFAFFDLEPMFNEAWLAHVGGKGIDDSWGRKIQERVNGLNAVLEKDRALGPQYRVGHSFLTPKDPVSNVSLWFEAVIETEIQPLLNEYWFDSPEKVRKAVEDLVKGL